MVAVLTVTDHDDANLVGRRRDGGGRVHRYDGPDPAGEVVLVDAADFDSCRLPQGALNVGQ